MLAASFGSASLYLVEEIEGGYFDKLRATPVSRMALVMGRLYAEFGKTAVLSTVMILVAFFFDVHIESGLAGFLVLVLMISLWAVAFSGFMQIIALKTRSAAATQSGTLIFFPLLFLTPNFVPRELLTRPMEIAATINPVTYIMEAARSLILEGFDWSAIGLATSSSARPWCSCWPSACASSPATTESRRRWSTGSERRRIGWGHMTTSSSKYDGGCGASS